LSAEASDPPPTGLEVGLGSVAVRRYVLVLGDPAGTRIEAEPQSFTTLKGPSEQTPAVTSGSAEPPSSAALE